MRTLLTVFRKEVLDNVRDRRTLASALIMGPLFGPLLFAFVINLSIERSLDDAERVIELPVIGQEYAPNLLRYLESRNIDVVEGPADRGAALDAVITGAHDVVVIIPPEFGEQFTGAVPARVEVIADQSNSQAGRQARRVRGALHAYGSEPPVGPRHQPARAAAAEHRRRRCVHAERPFRDPARHDELLLHLRAADGRHVPRYRHDRR